MQFHIDSEVGVLRDVLLGSIRHFTLNTPINSTQRHYYTIDPPRIQRLIEQERSFVEVLERHQVAIHQLPVQETGFTQFFVRDIATVVGETLVICRMKEAIRQQETAALNRLLQDWGGRHVQVDTGFLEGGDVLIDRSVMYVGLGERTDTAGLAFLERHFGDTLEIVPLKMASTFLHLDVVFNLLGKGDALVYASALDPLSLECLRKRYAVIEVTSEEQFNLATNVFSVDPETVIVDERNSRVNELLLSRGYRIIPLVFDEIGKIGGSFRCGTCPMRRD